MRETSMRCSIFEFTFERHFNYLQVLAWRIRNHEALKIKFARSLLVGFPSCVLWVFLRFEAEQC